MHGEAALNAVAGSMAGAVHSIDHERALRDFAKQTAVAMWRAPGLPEQEAEELATRPPAMPSIEPGALLWRLIEGRDT